MVNKVLLCPGCEFELLTTKLRQRKSLLTRSVEKAWDLLKRIVVWPILFFISGGWLYFIGYYYITRERTAPVLSGFWETYLYYLIHPRHNSEVTDIVSGIVLILLALFFQSILAHHLYKNIKTRKRIEEAKSDLLLTPVYYPHIIRVVDGLIHLFEESDERLKKLEKTCLDELRLVKIQLQKYKSTQQLTRFRIRNGKKYRVAISFPDCPGIRKAYDLISDTIDNLPYHMQLINIVADAVLYDLRPATWKTTQDAALFTRKIMTG